ncbi:MAG TPA: hypothetical protein VF637_18075 [Sphingomicrobium sp.]|jgi:hypothetical protein
MRARGEQREELEVPASSYPVFAYFRDDRQRDTISFVDGANMANAFGSGYRLHGMSVQLSNTRVAERVGDVLPWITKLSAEKMIKTKSDYRSWALPDTVQVRDFIVDESPLF